MTRAKDISKIVTDADLSGTLDVTGTFTSQGIDDNANATAITISEADKVLIGTTTTNWSGASTLLVKEASGDGGITIVSASTSNNGNIGFADTEGNDFANMRGLITYLHSDDAFRFMTANAERMRITSSGNVGIGTSSVNGTLHVQANPTAELSLWGGGGSYGRSKFNIQSVDDGTSTGKFQITTESTVPSSPELLTITNAGNVGIGTSSPNSRLTSASTDGSVGFSIHRTFSGDVSGETTIGGLDFTLTDTATSNQIVSRISPVGSAGTGDAFAGAMRFYTAGNDGSIAERMRIDSSGDYLFLGGTLRIKDSGNTSQRGAIYGDASSFHINAGVNNLIAYSAGGERMRIDSSGNVGIGTTSPSTLLHLKGDNATILLEDSSPDDAREASLFVQAGDLFLRAGNNLSSGSPTVDAQLVLIDGGTLTYQQSGTERMRIDSSGNLLVGKTASGSANLGGEIRPSGSILTTSDGGFAAVFNRENSHGEIIRLKKDDATIGGLYSSPSVTGPFFGHINVGLAMYHVGNSILPSGTGGLRDNAIDLGNSFNRFDDIYATNSTIQTSDRNEKQDIEELSEAEQRVAVVAKGLMRKFRWIDSVAEKGDNARTHFGIIAQDLQDAFTAEGLDAGDYAMFTSTTCWEKEISVDAVEADEENGIEAQEAYTYRKIAEEATEGYTERTRLGVRYNQLLAFIISAI